MQELNDFIKELEKKKNNYTELELVRYVYITLGQIMSFDLQFFYGNKENRTKIYRNSTTSNINNNFKSKTAICKSLSYLYEYILNKLGVHVESVTDYNDIGPYYHVFNIIFLKNGKMFSVDLQHDLENIQVNFRTKYFGKEIFDNKELEELDAKIGYISTSKKYTEDYFYLLKKALSYNIALNEKIKFLLENVNIYNDIVNMGYVERRNYYYKFINSFITNKEKNKIHFIDAYQIKDEINEYRLCIFIDMPNKENICFLYSNSKQKFEKYNLEQLSKLIQKGIIMLGNIPGIKKYIDKENVKIKI